MSTLHQLKEGFNDAWDHLVDGWQRLYRRAAGAMTRFTPGRKTGELATTGDSQALALRNVGWGVLAAEVFDDDDRVVVRLEAPGMKKGDFDLQVMDDYLVVRGEKQMEWERDEGDYHITECAYGRFERAVPLPAEVDADKAKASYRKGILRVDLPKTVASRRNRISVSVK